MLILCKTFLYNNVYIKIKVINKLESCNNWRPKILENKLAWVIQINKHLYKKTHIIKVNLRLNIHGLILKLLPTENISDVKSI